MFLLACTPEPAPPPTVWEYSEAVEPRAYLSTGQLESALEEVVATLHLMDPLALVDAFEDARTLGDGECPYEEEHNGQPVVSGDCTTDNGTTYLGFAAWKHFENTWLELDGLRSFHHRYDWATGLLRVLGADGWTLEVLGDDMLRVYEGDDGELVTYAYMWGDFYAEDNVWADTWLGDNTGVEMYYTAQQWPEDTTGSWDVGLSRLEGTARAANLLLLTSSATCPTEGSGTLDIEDAHGSWYTMIFDGDVACDGCGTASRDGVELGQVCGDMTFLVDWEERAWE